MYIDTYMSIKFSINLRAWLENLEASIREDVFENLILPPKKHHMHCKADLENGSGAAHLCYRV